MKNKNENSLGKILATIAGIGATVFAAKKIVDLYAQDGDGLISEDEYIEEIEREKSFCAISEDGNFFDFDLITSDANADILFETFLKKVNETCEMPTKVFTISDIEKLVPFEKSGIESKSNYGYAIMSMLGNQANRDYVVFLGNKLLSNIFTRESNNPDRNNFYWRNFKDERFIINPKYVKKEFN